MKLLRVGKNEKLRFFAISWLKKGLNGLAWEITNIFSHFSLSRSIFSYFKVEKGRSRDKN